MAVSSNGGGSTGFRIRTGKIASRKLTFVKIFSDDFNDLGQFPLAPGGSVIFGPELFTDFDVPAAGTTQFGPELFTDWVVPAPGTNVFGPEAFTDFDIADGSTTVFGPEEFDDFT